MRRRVVVSQITSRIRFVLGRDQIRSHMKSMLNATDGNGKRAAAVREGDAKFGKSIEHTAEHHRTNCQRRFSWHADKPRQPILWHSLFAEHVPRMNEDGRVELLGCAPDGLE